MRQGRPTATEFDRMIRFCDMVLGRGVHAGTNCGVMADDGMSITTRYCDTVFAAIVQKVGIS